MIGRVGAGALLVLDCVPRATAKGGLNNQVNRLAPLVLGSEQSDFATSQKECHLGTSKYYRSKITSSDRREYNIIAPELWRDCWIYQVKVGDKEIKVPALGELDFDSAGEEEVDFIPILLGTYEFPSRGREERGMVGKIIVE